MILCIPTMETGGLDGQVSGHFGRAPTFTVVDLDGDRVRVIKNRGEHMGGLGKPSEHVIKAGVKVVICAGLGPRAVEMLQSSGIDVYVGASGTVADAVQMWRDGKLRPASKDIACKEHHH